MMQPKHPTNTASPSAPNHAEHFDGIETRGSAIEGLGVFATRAFATEERILRFDHSDQIGPDRPFRPDLGEREAYVDQIAGGVEIYLPAPGRHVNSSCDPSARVRWDDGECWAVAKRPIKAGEEITVDYVIATHNYEDLPCHCGTARCRGVIPGSVFKLGDDWLREYEPLMAEWFIRENRAEYRAMCARLDLTPRV
jgi:hypothetical protein